ncbi:hypothetical protein M3Y94_01016800 [Aphelenchoides besseyi]|nr:hypothetical protein M3Y94_01016800 [Aphelenchoides besseyi]
MIVAKKMRRSNDQFHLEVLRFLDSHSLQAARLTCRSLNSLISEHLNEVARTHLEIVQIRQLDSDSNNNSRVFTCRCLPSRGSVKQFRTDSIHLAVEWLRPLVRGTFLRLFNLQNLDIDHHVLDALTQLPVDFRLVQLSLVGVSLRESEPQKLCDLMQRQLRATRYYFGRIRDVRSIDFFDGMLKSDAFLAMEKIQIDVATYVDRAYLGLSDDAIIEWFFEAAPILGYGVLIARDVELADDFLQKLLNRFLLQHTPKTISLVVCGHCQQNTSEYSSYVTIRNETSTCVVPNMRTGEQLEVEVLSKERLEIARRPLTKDAQFLDNLKDKNVEKSTNFRSVPLGAYKRVIAKR